MIVGKSIKLSSAGIIPPYIIYNYEGDYLDTATAVGDIDLPGYAFAGSNKLTSIDWSQATVRSIGRACFSQCSTLVLTKLPDELAYIGDALQETGGATDGAFYQCKRITIGEVPGAVKVIPFYCFSGCTSITNMIIHEGTTTLGAQCFADCTGLRNIDLPSTLSECDSPPFNRDSALLTITCRAITPPTLRSSSGFGTMSSLTNIYVPAASVDAYKTATNWAQYASKISAIPT